MPDDFQLGMCVKCKHKVIARCEMCGDYICFFHRILQPNGKFICFTCSDKYSTLNEVEKLDEALHEVEKQIAKEWRCFGCDAVCKATCIQCQKPCCVDHRVEKHVGVFYCLDCHYTFQEIDQNEYYKRN